MYGKLITPSMIISHTHFVSETTHYQQCHLESDLTEILLWGKSSLREFPLPPPQKKMVYNINHYNETVSSFMILATGEIQQNYETNKLVALISRRKKSMQFKQETAGNSVNWLQEDKSKLPNQWLCFTHYRSPSVCLSLCPRFDCLCHCVLKTISICLNRNYNGFSAFKVTGRHGKFFFQAVAKK